MLRFLWRLLVVGFPEKCEHTFDPYQIHKDGFGVTYVQRCSKCNELRKKAFRL